MDDVVTARLVFLGGTGGRHVVLVHGFGADYQTWFANAHVLMQEHMVWAVDLPGHGQADNAVGTGSPAELARAVADVIREVPSQLAVIGHSMGGTISLHLAALLGDRISHLVAIAPGGWGSGIDDTFLRLYPDVETLEDALALLQRVVARPERIRPQMAQHMLDMLNQPGRRAALRVIAEGVLAAPPPPQPSSANFKLVWGGLDRINRPDMARIAKLGNGCFYLPDVGHQPHQEAQSAFNAMLRTFLQN